MKPAYTLTSTLLSTLAFLALTGMLVFSLPTKFGGISALAAGASDEEAPDVSKGPHGGRLLTDGDFALEITIFEKGIPPEFHVYAYWAAKPIPAGEVELEIALNRLGGQVDHFQFSPQADFLRGDGVVTEPHSFDVSVTARHQGRTHRWSYENHEGRTSIAESMAGEAGIETDIAGPAVILEAVSLTGRIQTDPNRLSQVRPRFPGVVQTVHFNLGDTVKSGDVLATVQSDESLQTYAIRAPLGGLIVSRDIQVGESTGDKLLFTIADLSLLWVELDVFSRDLQRVQAGQEARIVTFDGFEVSGIIDWVSPLAAHASQSVRARVPMPNPDGRLRPGQFVRGEVTVARHDVPLAVLKTGLQRFRDFQVVFARFGDTYEVRMLDLGRNDGERIEVLGGLEAGTEYVSVNSYLVKADIEKSGASHDH